MQTIGISSLVLPAIRGFLLGQREHGLTPREHGIGRRERGLQLRIGLRGVGRVGQRGKRGRERHRNNVQLGRHGRDRSNLWSYPGARTLSRTSEEGNLLAMHPTVKPLRLVADALLDCTTRGDIVLDPFLGSGTTLLAAERVGRVCRALEIDPLYTDTAIRRWQDHTGEHAQHAESGRRFDEIAGDAALGTGP